ncbi:MAG: competence protein CoiA family protein [Elainellaceae cyanobacterium]
MNWALREGEKVKATKRAEAICPLCEQPLIAKCGDIMPPYWSHRKGDCDPWYEPETQWHLNWKALFPKEEQEVVLPPHRADIKTTRGVIELQNSPISPQEISERESFYGTMFWIFNCQKQYKNDQFFLDHQSLYSDRGLFIYEITWLHRKKSVLTCRKPVLLHLGQGRLLNIYSYEGRYGLGHFISQTEFFLETSRLFGSVKSKIKPPDYHPPISPEKQNYINRITDEYVEYRDEKMQIAKGQELSDDESRFRPNPIDDPDICPF